MTAAPTSFLVFIYKILQLEKHTLDSVSRSLTKSVSPKAFQTFSLRQCDAGRHVVTSCVLQKRGHHLGIRVAAASCVGAGALTKVRGGRWAAGGSAGLPYSRSLFSESSEADGLAGGSISCKMMHSGQLAQRPLHSRFLRWVLPETRREASNVSGTAASAQFYLFSGFLSVGALQR